MLQASSLKKKRPRKKRRQEIVNKFSNKSVAGEYAYAVYVLQDETSISHNEIFGEPITYTKTISEERDNKIRQFLLGDKKREIQKVGRSPGMRAQTLQAYLDLMEEHGERKENERKRAKLKNSKTGKM